MIAAADEVTRSVRGTVDLLNQRREALKAFDFSADGFFRSFAAIWLTMPALLVSLGFEFRSPAFARPDVAPLLGVWTTLVVAASHVAAIVALPLAMVPIARRWGLEGRYVPFVVVNNWISVIGLTLLAVPALLLYLGWAPAGAAGFATLVLALALLRVRWFAVQLTLGVGGATAAGLVLLDLGMNILIGAVAKHLIG